MGNLIFCMVSAAVIVYTASYALFEGKNGKYLPFAATAVLCVCIGVLTSVALLYA